MRAVAGDEVEEKLGDDIRAAEKTIYAQLIDEVEPIEGARNLIEFLKERGHMIVLPTRQSQRSWTTTSTARSTRIIGRVDELGRCRVDEAGPDLVVAAMRKIGADRAVMVGDSTFDCEEAGRAGVPTIGVLPADSPRVSCERQVLWRSSNRSAS